MNRPRCAELVTSLTMTRGVGSVPGSSESRWNPANPSTISGSPSSPRLFLDSLGVKQRGLGLRANPSVLSNFADSMQLLTRFGSLSIFLALPNLRCMKSIFCSEERCAEDNQTACVIHCRMSKKRRGKSGVAFLVPRRLRCISDSTLACTLCLYECLIMCHCPKLWDRVL